MKEEEPVDGKKSEDDGIEKENLAILEKIRKNQRQDHLNVSGSEGRGEVGMSGCLRGTNHPDVPHTPGAAAHRFGTCTCARPSLSTPEDFRIPC